MADTRQGSKINVSPPNNIYTMLAIIATLFLLFGTVYLAVKSNALFGTWLPSGL